MEIEKKRGNIKKKSSEREEEANGNTLRGKTATLEKPKASNTAGSRI